MPTDTKLKELIINELTEEQYNALTPNENELYLTPDNSTPDTKTISLFGNHSILVPKDSTDTNIDLYNHYIFFSCEKNDGANITCTLNAISSKNLVVDSLTDLTTLLGSSFDRSAYGFVQDATTPLLIVGVADIGFILSDANSVRFSELSKIIITDTVTTI